VFFCKTFEEDLDGNGSDAWFEVEKAQAMDTHPIGHVFGVC
jgi:hypothetical protein